MGVEEVLFQVLLRFGVWPVRGDVGDVWLLFTQNWRMPTVFIHFISNG